MRYFIFVLLILSFNTVFGQDYKFPSNVKKGDIFIKCELNNGKKSEMTKVIQNISSKKLRKIQTQLKSLEYDIEITGLLDVKTKSTVSDFNNKECGICTDYVTEKTVSVLRKVYRQSLREKRH